MKLSVEVELAPFVVPTHVHASSSGAPGVFELRAIPRETLEVMCERFRREVFKRAGMEPGTDVITYDTLDGPGSAVVGGEPPTVLHMHGGEWLRREAFVKQTRAAQDQIYTLARAEAHASRQFAHAQEQVNALAHKLQHAARRVEELEQQVKNENERGNRWAQRVEGLERHLRVTRERLTHMQTGWTLSVVETRDSVCEAIDAMLEGGHQPTDGNEAADLRDELDGTKERARMLRNTVHHQELHIAALRRCLDITKNILDQDEISANWRPQEVTRTRQFLSEAIANVLQGAPSSQCTQHAPDKLCTTPSSCAENGCSAVERDLPDWLQKESAGEPFDLGAMLTKAHAQTNSAIQQTQQVTALYDKCREELRVRMTELAQARRVQNELQGKVNVMEQVLHPDVNRYRFLCRQFARISTVGRRRALRALNLQGATDCGLDAVVDVTMAARPTE